MNRRRVRLTWSGNGVPGRQSPKPDLAVGDSWAGPGSTGSAPWVATWASPGPKPTTLEVSEITGLTSLFRMEEAVGGTESIDANSGPGAHSVDWQMTGDRT